jgi:hypothetical protein
MLRQYDFYHLSHRASIPNSIGDDDDDLATG